MEIIEGKIDLHTHSVFSDGENEPEELGAIAERERVEAFAIADHDTVSGFREYLKYAKNFDAETVPAIELGIKDDARRGLKEVHILGYFIDCKNKSLNRTLNMLNKSKSDWLPVQVEKLNRNGIRIDAEDVIEAAGSAVPRRPHIWRAIEKNEQNAIQEGEFFRRTSFGGDLYAKKSFEITLEDSVSLIKKAGGIPVLAHPGYYENFEEVFVEAINAGVEGIEVRYPYDKLGNKEAKAAVRRANILAEEFNLIKTGGSDFHGKGHGVMLGSVYVPYGYLLEMKKHKSGERKRIPRQYHHIDSSALKGRYCRECYNSFGELNVMERENGTGEYYCTVCELG